MKNKKFQLGLVLFLLGMAGVLSMLTVQIPLDALPAIARERFTDGQLKWLMLANPAILVLIMVLIGTLLHERAGLTVPTIKGWLNRAPIGSVFIGQLKAGVLFGALAGALIVGVSAAFSGQIGDELEKLASGIQPSLLARFLYGGITEELLLRFGVMTLLMWLAVKMMPSSAAAWTSIVLASVLFAIGHLPAVHMVIKQPGAAIYAYIILANVAGGLVFGWLYWKKGLEAAMIGHMMAHVVMVGSEMIVSN
jgi:Type II CAAX prenyl endopeptidase Rce1-like